MNINEFLISDVLLWDSGHHTYFKIKYNENIILIYKSFYRDNFINHSSLDFVGIFDILHNQLYIDNTYNDNEELLECEYYKGSINSIKEQLNKRLDYLLEEYISKNENELIELAMPYYNHYISEQENYLRIKNKVLNAYFYDEKIPEMSFQKGVRNVLEWYENKIILGYLQNPDKVAKEMFEIYINKEDYCYELGKNSNTIIKSKKEKVGFNLLIYKLKLKMLNEIVNNPSKEDKRKRNIISAIKNIDAQIINITIKYNGKTIKFEYSKNDLYNLYFDINNIKNLEIKEKLKHLFKDIENYNQVAFQNIMTIEYKNNVVYKNKLL